MGDVDAINERLNGLVHLLQVVGIEGGNVAPQSSSSSSSSDAQILELIKKLQLAQADSPEILAALKSPELRALASLAAQKQASTTQRAAAAEPVAKKAPPALDDIMDDDDNYPKIGPGYSDDISVVSDMTTPTVMTRQQVADEEQYKEVSGGPGALPPMNTLSTGPAQPARPSLGMMPMQRYSNASLVSGGGKTKNMVGQVRPGQAHRAIAKSGGAAAQRRLNYQMAMTKLQSDPAGSPRKTQKEVFSPASPTPSQQTPMEFPSMADNGSGGKNAKKGKEKIMKKSKKTALAAQEVSDLDFEGTEPIRTPTTSATSGSTGSSVGGGGGRKKSLTPVTPNDMDWGMADTGGWQAFDTSGGGSNGGGQDIFVDNKGFFPNDAFGSSDPFAHTATSPTPSSNSRAKSPRGRPTSNGSKKAVPSKKLSSGRLKKEGDAKRSERSDKPGKKKIRSRSSLTM